VHILPRDADWPDTSLTPMITMPITGRRIDGVLIDGLHRIRRKTAQSSVS